MPSKDHYTFKKIMILSTASVHIAFQPLKKKDKKNNQEKIVALKFSYQWFQDVGRKNIP